MIIGTAGHVDHGKTTLVRALTGVDADRLPEEKRRGMTIDLGYAYAGGLGFVDVPGHERLVHTMLAGAGGIDAALLVVAADDGVMPQTIEHARILDLLGVDRGVVAVTRIDLAPRMVAQVAAEAKGLLAGTALAGAAVLPVSAVTGEGIGALRAALLALGPRGREDGGYARLSVDRAFLVAGAGLVVTGMLVAGRIAVGDRLLVSPSGLPVRVRGLHAQNRPAEAAAAGQRVALNLAGTSGDAVARGDWVLHPALHAPASVLDARIRLLADALPLRNDRPVHLHLAASHVTARLAPLRGVLAPGEAGPVRLVLERPIAALALDRLVLRDAGASVTIGGGVVLDPWPAKRGARSASGLARLAALDRPAVPALAAVLAAGPIEFFPFARARNLTEPDGIAALAAADAVLLGGFALRRTDAGSLRAALVQALAARHRDRPDLPGLEPERLRLGLAERPPPALFRATLAAALRDGVLRQDGAWLHLPAHRVVLSEADMRIWEMARPLLTGFSPPRVRDLAQATGVAEEEIRAALQRIARLGRVVEVAQDHFFPRATVAELAAAAAGLQPLTAAAFRDRLGIGRKVAIQVLEFFDAAGITRRVGETRQMRPERMRLFDAVGAAAERFTVLP